MALRPNRLALAAFFAGLSLILGLAPRVTAQEDKPLRLDVKLVSLFVNVTDQKGAIIGGLTKDDFKITEDGRLQTIAVFERQSEMPLNLTLAIDTSSSTYKDRYIEQQAAKKFVGALIRSQDQMNVLQFATYVTELTGFTNNVSKIDHGSRFAWCGRHGAVRRHLSRIAGPRQKGWPQGAGACLRWRRHGERHHLP